jgi:serine/threonine-protein phosphatase 6 regulatory subunit 3
MSLLNRSSEYDHLYDVEGRLQGGLTGLEELGNAISSNPVRSSDNAEQGEDEMEPALELPVTGSSHSSSMVDSDEDMDEPEPGSSDSDAMEEIDMFDDVVSSSPSTTPVVDSLPHIQVNTQALLSASPVLSPITHSPDSLKSGSSHLRKSSIGSDSDLSTLGPRSSRRSTRRNTIDLVHSSQELPIGERLKRRFIDLNLMTTLLVSVMATYLSGVHFI